jgi:hypothetical protein
MSPVMAQSRHPGRVGECPLSGVKRTSQIEADTSAFDHMSCWESQNETLWNIAP